MDNGDAAKEYAAGFAVGVATVIVGHPFDTVKVKLQAYNTKTQVKEYKNAFQCTSRILGNEGVKGLYRGASSSFIGMAVESSLFFGTYCQMKKLLQGEAKTNQPQLQIIIPSAAVSGAMISLILCPSELVKCRLQVQGTESSVSKYAKYTGPLDCAIKTIKSEGVKGIFRGGYATFLRESVGNATFFSTYEFCRYYMHMQLESPTYNKQAKVLTDIGIGIISGGLAGMSFWTAVLPVDVAKTVIQTAPDTNSNRNPFQTLISIYRTVGFRGCYAGLGPTLARAFPANAAAMVTWEFTAKILGIRRDT